jgi:hypothetical protein
MMMIDTGGTNQYMPGLECEKAPNRSQLDKLNALYSPFEIMAE